MSPDGPECTATILNSNRPIIAKHYNSFSYDDSNSFSQYSNTLCLVQTRRALPQRPGARIASGLAQFRKNKSPGLRLRRGQLQTFSHTLPPPTPPLGSANGLPPSGSDLQQHELSRPEVCARAGLERCPPAHKMGDLSRLARTPARLRIRSVYATEVFCRPRSARIALIPINLFNCHRRR